MTRLQLLLLNGSLHARQGGTLWERLRRLRLGLHR